MTYSMMFKVFFSLLLVVSASVVVFAEENETTDAMDICTYAQAHNVKEGFFIPWFIPYGNDVFNVYSDEDVVGTITIENSEITSVKCGETSDSATYAVQVKDKQTLEDIFEAESPVDEYNAKRGAGDLTVDGVTFLKDVKSGFSNVLTSIAGWFV